MHHNLNLKIYFPEAFFYRTRRSFIIVFFYNFIFILNILCRSKIVLFIYFRLFYIEDIDKESKFFLFALYSKILYYLNSFKVVEVMLIIFYMELS